MSTDGITVTSSQHNPTTSDLANTKGKAKSNKMASTAENSTHKRTYSTLEDEIKELR